jgi:hypothetical protein
MLVRIPVSRRRFLATAAASTAISAAGGIARPYLSRAADRPLITHGIQSGDVSNDSAVVWARADRPARMLAEVATTDSFKTVHRAVFVDALPETDFTANALIEGPAGGAGHLLPHPLPGSGLADDRRRADDRAFSQRAGRPPFHLVRLVRGYRRPGLGHRRGPRRHAHLRDHAAQPARISSSIAATTSTPTARSSPR